MKERSRVRGRRVEEAEESGASRAGIEGKALPANGKKSSMSISHTLHAAHAALRWHNLPSPLPLYPLLTHTRHAAKIDLSQVCVVRSTCNLANLQLIIESHRNESRINSSWLCVAPPPLLTPCCMCVCCKHHNRLHSVQCSAGNSLSAPLLLLFLLLLSLLLLLPPLFAISALR